jgi:hypothetical protein
VAKALIVLEAEVHDNVMEAFTDPELPCKEKEETTDGAPDGLPY